MKNRGAVLFLTLLAALVTFNCQWVLTCGAKLTELKNMGMWWQIVTASLLLAAPGALWRRLWPSAVLTAAAYLVMLANMLYLRTFGSWIPWGSYFAVGNLADFTDAVADSFRPSDALMPLILIAGYWLASRCQPPRFSARRLLAGAVALLISAGAAAFCFNRPEPLGDKLRELARNHNRHALAASRFSLPVVTAHEALTAPRLTKANRRKLRNLFARRVTDVRTSRFDNLVVIFMESLEGWPVGLTVGGREVTPVMNALMADTANMGVTRLLHDTGPGRSIDAQLVLLSGIIPTRDRIFSFAYPGNTYPSVYHALKSRDRSIVVRSFTTDHEGIYNLGRIAPRLGVDSLYCWAGAPRAGRHKRRRGHRLTDGDFFRRVISEVDSAGLWPADRPKVMQLATYTCHAPYRPVSGADFESPAVWPVELRNYLKVVNYTDSVLGDFVAWLKSKPDYDRTLVVVMGDHPTFGPGQREELAAFVPAAAEEAVPLLMLNAGAAGFRGAARQVDVYSTMIALLGLADYDWHGVGSPLLPGRPRRLRSARALSTLILNYNLYRPSSSH